MVSVAAVLERELGAPGGGVAGASYEETPELRFPGNLAVYDAMRRTWSRGRAMQRAITGPILALDATIPETSRVRPEVRAFVEAELGLAKDDQGRRRTRDRGVAWDEFLRHALLHLFYGFMPFEQVAEPGRPDEGVDPGIGPTVIHLRKLAPRMPRSVSDIVVADDGGLEGIRQLVMRRPSPGAAPRAVDVLIPVDKLVMFVNEREGADWAGQSIFRDAYRHYLFADLLMRTGALAVDRQGMGVPVVTYDPATHSKREALAIATGLRSGDEAGVALPAGMTLSLEGVTGSVVDPLPQIKMHLEEAGRAAMMMFLDLGHGGGLGEAGLSTNFIEWFLLSEKQVVRYVETIAAAHVIRDLVTWNFGPAEPAPPLVFSELKSGEPTAEALNTLQTAGLLGNVDRPLVAHVRRQWGLPEQAPEEAPNALPAPSGPPPALTTDRAGRPVGQGDVVGVEANTGIGQPAFVRGTVTRVAAAGPELGFGGPGTGQPFVPVASLEVQLADGRAVRLPAATVLRAGLTAEQESERIRVARATPEARSAHRFRPARWTHPNGHPRCALCGCEERTGGCAGADQDGLTTSAPGSKGVAHAAAGIELAPGVLAAHARAVAARLSALA